MPHPQSLPGLEPCWRPVHFVEVLSALADRSQRTNNTENLTETLSSSLFLIVLVLKAVLPVVSLK
jgi:hypothetical protein